MSKKRGKDEEVLLFAMKVVGSVVAVFIAAIMIDIASLSDWIGSASSGGSRIAGDVSAQQRNNEIIKQ